MKRVILWFRQDLRLHDNEALIDALSVADEIVPVYVFDQRIFNGKTDFGFDKIREARTRFIVQSVENLRHNIRTLGSELIIRIGHPEEEIFKIAQEVKSSWVFCNRERTPEETAVQDALEKQLWTIGQEVRFARGKMLFYTSDLPYPITHVPDNFITFRKETERFVTVRTPLDSPRALTRFTIAIKAGQIPSVEYLLNRAATRSSLQDDFVGGEKQALNQLVQLKKDLQFETRRDGDPQNEKLPRFSPWLTHGCLSPKKLYEVVEKNGRYHSTLAEQIVSGLLYRDYLRLMVKKHGQRIFDGAGVRGVEDEQSTKSLDGLRTWAEGRTGLPIVDSAMKELNRSGFINVGLRKICAVFLIRELGVHWRLGASYFESTLIDYDPCSNWANWCNIAGVGPDTRDVRNANYTRELRHFNPH